MRTVFVINQSGHDYAPASKFGQIIFLSKGTTNRYATNSLYRKFAEILKHSHEDDYILVTGLTIGNMIAASIMTCLHGRVNFLLFKEGRYVERTLIIGELLTLDDDNVLRSKSERSETNKEL